MAVREKYARMPALPCDIRQRLERLPVLMARHSVSLAYLFGSAGVISRSLYRRLRGAGGFRNVLVHEYLQIDLERVARFLSKAPAVFRAFADELIEWLRAKEKRQDEVE